MERTIKISTVSQANVFTFKAQWFVIFTGQYCIIHVTFFLCLNIFQWLYWPKSMASTMYLKDLYLETKNISLLISEGMVQNLRGLYNSKLFHLWKQLEISALWKERRECGSQWFSLKCWPWLLLLVLFANYSNNTGFSNYFSLCFFPISRAWNVGHKDLKTQWGQFVL